MDVANTSTCESASDPREPKRLKTSSPRSVANPDINDELVGLYDGGVSRGKDYPRNGLRVGESWYAGYVLNLSASASDLLNRRSPSQSHSTGLLAEEGEESSGVGTAALPSLPSANLVEQLLEDYFARFHVLCPILDRVDFLQSVKDGTVSSILLQCVLYVASIHCKQRTIQRLGYTNRVDAGDELYGRACAAFHADQSSDGLTLVQCSYLLHYWFGEPTTYRDARWWLTTAISLAQRMGYHRRSRTGAQVDWQRRKRVWWCLYIRDRQIALSIGTPMFINDQDCDVESLTIEDFPLESPETIRYMLLQAELNIVASEMYYSHCSPRRLQLAQDSSIFRTASHDIHAKLTAWKVKAQQWLLWYEIHPLSLTLKICYFYYSMNLQQRLQSASPPLHVDATIVGFLQDAADEVSYLTGDALLHLSAEHFPMILVSALLSAITVYVADIRHLRINQRQLSLSIRPCLFALQQLEQVYILAHWIRSLFMRMISGSKSEGNLLVVSSSAQPQAESRPRHIYRSDSHLDNPVESPASSPGVTAHQRTTAGDEALPSPLPQARSPGDRISKCSCLTDPTRREMDPQRGWHDYLLDLDYDGLNAAQTMIPGYYAPELLLELGLLDSMQ